jgi:hypothetical protein
MTLAPLIKGESSLDLSIQRRILEETFMTTDEQAYRCFRLYLTLYSDEAHKILSDIRNRGSYLKKSDETVWRDIWNSLATEFKINYYNRAVIWKCALSLSPRSSFDSAVSSN